MSMNNTFKCKSEQVGSFVDFPLTPWDKLFSAPLVLSPISSVQFSSVSNVQLFETLWTAAHQASLSITNSQSLLKLIFNELLMLLNHLILFVPFFCLQSFPGLGSFPMSQLFAAGGQSMGASASTSVLPMNIQD